MAEIVVQGNTFKIKGTEPTPKEQVAIDSVLAAKKAEGKGGLSFDDEMKLMITPEEVLSDAQKGKYNKDTESFLASNSLNFRLGFLITSDEEGQAINGTRKVIETFNSEKKRIDYCLVGEPSSTEILGDTIKIGRRGSLSCKLKVIGIEGHVAYPQLASNPIHNALPALAELTACKWDSGNNSFPPTSFQISNIHAGVGPNNVIPDVMEVDFNLRYSTELDAETIKNQVQTILDKDGIEYEIYWHLSGEPYLTTETELIDIVAASVAEETGVTPQCSTAGGTSDGRFISPAGSQVVEFGPCNVTIHKINERIKIDDIDKLAAVYESVLKKMFQLIK